MDAIAPKMKPKLDLSNIFWFRVRAVVHYLKLSRRLLQTIKERRTAGKEEENTTTEQMFRNEWKGGCVKNRKQLGITPMTELLPIKTRDKVARQRPRLSLIEF